jgi:hypothetical protein
VTVFLWVCGPSGVGKSSVGWAVFSQVLRDGHRAAYLDFDQIGFCLPAPADDPENHRMSASNLGVMWPNFRSAGATCLIASGIVQRAAEIQMHAAAVPDTTLTVCRLRANPDQLRQRVYWRGAGYGPPLPGNEMPTWSAEQLRRAADDSVAEAEQMDRADLGDICIDTDNLTIDQVARAVRAAVAIP